MRKKKIAVIYHSQSQGNTRAAAEEVVGGIVDAGTFEIYSANTNDQRVDPTVLADCAGVAFGTPDYFSYPAGGVKMFMDDWLITQRGGNEDIKGMPIALFLTHGGGGLAEEPFEELMEHVGPTVGETLMIKGHPDEQDAAKCRELGRQLAEAALQFMEQAQP